MSKEPATPLDDFRYAKAAGLMFDPVQVTNDQAVDWALRSKGLVSKEHVVAGFLVSLTSRRLDLRSALGVSPCSSIYHLTGGAEPTALNTPVRLWSLRRYGGREDLNVLNLESFKDFLGILRFLLTLVLPQAKSPLLVQYSQIGI